jgi:hypothetical protein
MSYIPSYQRPSDEPALIRRLKESLPHDVILEQYVTEYSSDSFNSATVQLMFKSYHGTRYNRFKICVGYHGNFGRDGVDYDAIFIERVMEEMRRQHYGFGNNLSGGNGMIDIIADPRPSLKEEFKQADPINLPNKLKSMKKDINKLEKTIKNRQLLLLI